MNIDEILFYVGLVLSIINAVITYVRTGSLKGEIMKFRSSNYKESLTDEEKKAQSQKFSHLKTEYALNERTGVLEKKEEKLDLQKLINSSVETALDRMLNRFMPEKVRDTEELYQEFNDDLIDYAQVLERAEDYREQFGLSSDISVKDIYKRVGEESDKLKTQIDTIKQKSIKKEIVKDEETQKDE